MFVFEIVVSKIYFLTNFARVFLNIDKKSVEKRTPTDIVIIKNLVYVSYFFFFPPDFFLDETTFPTDIFDATA